MPRVPGFRGEGRFIGKGNLMKKLVIGCVMAAGMVFASGGAASAGETTGNGGSTPAPERAGSICAFSGQDLPDDVENNPSPEEDDDWLGHGVQSYGQLVSHGLKAVIPNPGTACRGYASMR